MTHSYDSPCKINLGLEVLSVRADGYHNIHTVFYRLDDPDDVIEVSEADNFRLSCSDPSLPNDESNLVFKAIRACAELFGDELPKLHLHLIKNLPIGAGIGGGSANAAKAIQIYSELVKPIHNEDKHLIAAKLGADVAFFVSGYKAAIGTEKGEVLSPIDLIINQPILLAKLPHISISTKEAYNKIVLRQEALQSDLSNIIHQPIANWRVTLHNDFESFAFESNPPLGEIKKMMYEGGAEFALMSGSGSLIYGIFPNNESAITTQKIIRKEHPEVFTFISNQT